jgi:hypothetical protein
MVVGYGSDELSKIVGCLVEELAIGCLERTGKLPGGEGTTKEARFTENRDEVALKMVCG